MATCLLALGSNLGDRAATLNHAVAELAASVDVKMIASSNWYSTEPVGTQLHHEFLNGAALVETELGPAAVLKLLRRIEAEHGRQRQNQPTDRTLDLDLLTYDRLIINTPELMLPHPRMSFRRFVLEPATEIAGQLVHPTIGWTLQELINQLESGADRLAILSTSETSRQELSAVVTDRFAASIVKPPQDSEVEKRWPAAATVWIAVPPDPQRQHVAGPRANFPKLTILLDPTLNPDDRGPSLKVSAAEAPRTTADVLAAVQAVWPHLGS